MFLFKLTLPFLGTATIDTVGTGIYYGVESWKKNDQKTTQVIQVENGGENGKGSETTPTTSPVPDSSTEEEAVSPSSPVQSDAPSVTFGFEPN